jgi:hypothetical protein
MRFTYIIIPLLAILVLSSCQTQDYYRAKAVEKARKFAIPRLRDLKETQLDYIRYSPPVLMDSEIFTRYQTNDKSVAKNDIYQTCIVWDVPGLDYSIVIFGVSERRMDSWVPERLIRKKFHTAEAARDAAVALSVEYAMNNMLYLSDEMRNRIRFSPPRDYRTKFELDSDKFKTKKKLTRREKDVDAYKKSLHKQYSFVWDTDNENEKIVISGFSMEKFDGWVAITGLVRSKAELEEYTFTHEELEKEKAENEAKAKANAVKPKEEETDDGSEITEVSESLPLPPSKGKVADPGPVSDPNSGFKQLNKFQR